MIALVLLAALSLLGAAATLVTVVRDGYRRVPTRPR
ncbi:hypothetical protein BH09ACT5_BH09ACT5_16710 [soil metagenome]